MNFFNSFIFIIKNNFIITYKEGISILTLGFYILTIAIYPFTSNILIKNFNVYSISIIWISLLFSILLTLENIFHKYYEDGSLDLLFLTKISLEYLILIKTFIHWITIGLPLIIITPFLFFILNIEFQYFMIISLALATFNIINLSVICASLTLSIKQKGILLSLITIPLLVPTIIFSFSDYYLLSLNTIILFTITPFISSIALRLSFE